MMRWSIVTLRASGLELVLLLSALLLFSVRSLSASSRLCACSAICANREGVNEVEDEEEGLEETEELD
jgi:hypothetical protein